MPAMTPNIPEIHVYCDDWQEYELLDSGNRRKLERFGQYILIREEPKAWWKPELPDKEWARAVAEHAGDERGAWEFRRQARPEWELRFERLTLEARLTATSKHVGVFPEQAAHWRWIAAQLAQCGRKDVRALNLFGYTGVASLVAASGGAAVTHVDAAKGVVAWGRQNQERSGLAHLPVRWIVDDVGKFVKRELRRERRYDAILLDPPSFGRGPNKELWKIDQQIGELLDDCRQLLSDAPLFVLMTLYSLEQSSLLLANLLRDMMRGAAGQIEIGELALKPKASENALSMSLFGRWSAANISAASELQ